MTPALTITQDQIEDFQQTGSQFMRDLLGVDEALLTDISELSDFTFSGMPIGTLDTSLPLRELTATWDAWAIAEVESRYGITLTTTKVNMVALLNQIEVSRRQLVH
jgi:hypothetical protein